MGLRRYDVLRNWVCVCVRIYLCMRKYVGYRVGLGNRLRMSTMTKLISGVGLYCT